jgi:hypothetical protein
MPIRPGKMQRPDIFLRSCYYLSLEMGNPAQWMRRKQSNLYKREAEASLAMDGLALRLFSFENDIKPFSGRWMEAVLAALINRYLF